MDDGDKEEGTEDKHPTGGGRVGVGGNTVEGSKKKGKKGRTKKHGDRVNMSVGCRKKGAFHGAAVGKKKKFEKRAEPIRERRKRESKVE